MPRAEVLNLGVLLLISNPQMYQLWGGFRFSGGMIHRCPPRLSQAGFGLGAPLAVVASGSAGASFSWAKVYRNLGFGWSWLRALLVTVGLEG